MDQIKTGKFIASLRKRHSLTQEALGEKLSVTNKTVSRWENGNYMPDIEMLQLISKEFDISINELLAGECLSDEEFRRKADENVVAVSKSSAFSFEERKAYFKEKWRKEHILLLVVLGVFLIASAVLPFIFDRPWFVGFVPLLAFIEYGYQNNQMLVYVENRLYDGYCLDEKRENSIPEKSNIKRKTRSYRLISQIGTLVICIGLGLSGFELIPISATVYFAILGLAAQMAALVILNRQ